MSKFGYPQVVAAAEQLEREGERATARGVLKRMGGGSLSAIAEHLRRWREGAPALPLEMCEPSEDAIELLRRQIQHAASFAVHGFRAQIEERERECLAALAEAERLARHAAALQEKLDESEKGAALLRRTCLDDKEELLARAFQITELQSILSELLAQPAIPAELRECFNTMARDRQIKAVKEAAAVGMKSLLAGASLSQDRRAILQQRYETGDTLTDAELWEIDLIDESRFTVPTPPSAFQGRATDNPPAQPPGAEDEKRSKKRDG